MSTLYTLTGEYLQLLEMAMEPQKDEEDAIRDTMEAIEGEIEIKAEGYAKVIRMVENDIAGIDEEIDRLRNRKAALSGNVDRMKKNLQKAMELTGKTKFKTTLFSFNIQKNPASLVVDDETKVPAQFLIPQPPKVDNAAIKSLLKEGVKTEYAHLEQTRSLRIR